jgi:Fic family protein
MQPPFEVDSGIAAQCVRIERLIGLSEGRGGEVAAPQLRRANRIRTVQATAAIEGNTLSEEQVTAVLEGKRVRGPEREVLEVKNALAAYALLERLNPRSEKDLLRAHATLMSGLSNPTRSQDAGRYRRGNVGISTGSRVTHVAPPAKRVPALMRDLFQFLASRKPTSPLIKACVFHYELEFIHPFSDGNGRAGRLWQTAILCAHSKVFAHVPTESLIKARQAAYYEALARSDKAGNANAFIAFMLEQIRESLETFSAELRPVRATGEDRLGAAAKHFGKLSFSRKDYLALHPGISQPTASRDLRDGVQRGLLRAQGEKALTRYAFQRARSGSRRR